MFKAIVFAAILAFAFAAPEPKPKPVLVAGAYTAPVVGAPLAYHAPLAYSSPVVSGYSAPVVSAYNAYSTYHGVAPAVQTYTAPLVVA